MPVAATLFCIAGMTVATLAQVRQKEVTPSSAAIRAEREAFLSSARIITEPPTKGSGSWRATLDDGIRRHDASVETADGSDPTRRNYKFNVAAYELDKLLQLDLVPPSVERLVSGRPASVTWWVDNVVMDEVSRRRKAIDPPDPERWSRQVDAVRVFDELVSNTYRNTSPGLYFNAVWDNLLIATDWSIAIIDHTAAFRTREGLEDQASLLRCPRTVLARLRMLDRQRLQQTLGRYLSSVQLDALEARRVLLVRHFDREIATRGEAAVLYDLRPMK